MRREGTEKVVWRDTTVNKYLKNSINESVFTTLGKQHTLAQEGKYFQSKQECDRSEYRDEVGRSTGVYHLAVQKDLPRSSEL